MSAQASGGAVDNKPAGIEGLKAANTLTSQVITVAAGLVAFTVTFAEKFTPAGKPITLPPALKLSWLCFTVTIVFGFWTLMAITGTLGEIDRGQRETNPKRTNIIIPAFIMLVIFLLGVILLIAAGLSVRDGFGMASTGYLFLPPVNGDSCVVPDRHQAGRRRDLEPVRLHLPVVPAERSA
jgi:hypothetical protein